MFLAHIRPLIQIILHIYVRQEFVQEIRDTRKNIYVLDRMQEFDPLDEDYDDIGVLIHV